MATAWPSPETRVETAAGRLGIGRMRLVVRHARGRRPPPVPDGEELGTAIADALATMLDPGDPAVWVVRSLVVPAYAEYAPGAAELARAVAQRLREAVARVLRGEKAEGVIRYPDRAAWLAALLWDHVRGEARGRWAYARFAALDALPLAFVPRQLFAMEPDLAVPALLRLAAAGRLRAFASAIGESGARPLLPLVLTGRPTARTEPRAAAALARRLVANAGPALPVASGRALLVALIEAAAAAPGEAPLDRATATAAQAQALAAPAPAPASNPAPAGATSSRYASPSPASPPSTAALAPAPAPAAPTLRPAAPLAPDGIVDTAYAGLFLLWRSVAELGLEALWPPDVDPGPMRLTLAASLAGPDRDSAWNDPALHWLAGFVPEPGSGPIAAPPGLEARFRAHMARRAEPRPLHPVARSCGRLRLVQDRGSEDWLAVGTARDTAPLRAAPAPPDLRDPARDIAFFGLARDRPRRPWALLARAAYGDLARRLVGLDRSSGAWLWTNVLAGWGQLVPGEPARLHMPRVSLDLVLRMTGLDGSDVALADGRRFRIELPGRN
ncbi:MAG TPA: hypothetical protein VF605_09435 [Allosphingosinicella sp.]|jgi:hypothetical protein